MYLEGFTSFLHTGTLQLPPQQETRKKQYRTKEYGEKLKVAALEVLYKGGLDAELCSKVLMSAIPKQQLCRCHKDWTCSLCMYACCEQAQRKFCVCLCRTICPTHGKHCKGSHE